MRGNPRKYAREEGRRTSRKEGLDLSFGFPAPAPKWHHLVVCNSVEPRAGTRREAGSQEPRLIQLERVAKDARPICATSCCHTAMFCAGLRDFRSVPALFVYTVKRVQDAREWSACTRRRREDFERPRRRTRRSGWNSRRGNEQPLGRLRLRGHVQFPFVRRHPSRRLTSPHLKPPFHVRPAVPIVTRALPSSSSSRCIWGTVRHL